MKFQKFGDVIIRYVGESKNVEGNTLKARVMMRFPDINRVKTYFADPNDPFEKTIALIDDMQINFHLPIHEFESLIDQAIQSDLFSKISLN